jgi:hypothetical protein
LFVWAKDVETKFANNQMQAIDRERVVVAIVPLVRQHGWNPRNWRFKQGSDKNGRVSEPKAPETK